MIFDETSYKRQFQEVLNQYAPVTEESFTKLLSLVRFVKVSKGAIILSAGQIAKETYFVCQGALISRYADQDGSTHIKNFFTEGNFAGSKVSQLLSSPSDFSIESLEDGVVIVMDHRKYRQLIFENEDLKHFYIAYLEQSWVIKNEKRQIAFATQTATERYLTSLEEYPTLDQRVPLLHIASYLGITPTQLSRIRKNLQK